MSEHVSQIELADSRQEIIEDAEMPPLAALMVTHFGLTLDAETPLFSLVT